MDHPSMSGLDMLNSPHNGDSISSGSMTSLPMSADTHPSQLSHPGMYSHTSSVTSMMSPHSSIGHPHHPHHPQAPHVTLPDTDTDPRYVCQNSILRSFIFRHNPIWCCVWIFIRVWFHEHFGKTYLKVFSKNSSNHMWITIQMRLQERLYPMWTI